MSESESEKKGGCFLITAFYALILVCIIKLIRPSAIPFSFFEFWETKGSIWEAVRKSWIPFAWGAGVTTLFAIFTSNDPDHNINAEKHLFYGLLTSIWAGVVEEIYFRWLIFYSSIVGVKLMNWLFFGWLGFGITEYIYLHILGPVANFFTLGYLHSILFNGFGWAVGAAVISSNGKFRDGHSYQGLLGYTNSWFLGMFFFWLMFHYGLPAAILVHFLYDLFIFIVRYIDMVIERKLGWT